MHADGELGIGLSAERDDGVASLAAEKGDATIEVEALGRLLGGVEAAPRWRAGGFGISHHKAQGDLARRILGRILEIGHGRQCGVEVGGEPGRRQGGATGWRHCPLDPEGRRCQPAHDEEHGDGDAEDGQPGCWFTLVVNIRRGRLWGAALSTAYLRHRALYRRSVSLAKAFREIPWHCCPGGRTRGWSRRRRQHA